MRSTEDKITAGLGGVALQDYLQPVPLETYQAGDTILDAGSKTGKLFVLKKGSVSILNDTVEIARVTKSGAVFGEISSLLDQPHMAGVVALEKCEFFVADAALLLKEPEILLHVAKLLAERLVAVDRSLIDLKKKIHANHSPKGLNKIIDDIEILVRASGSNLEQWM